MKGVNHMAAKESDVEEKKSGEFLELKDFFSIFVKIASSLVGFATLFVLLGYTIILTFINRLQLYGLASFPQEFYKEATLKFVSDLFECYGRHPYFSGAIVIITFAVAFIPAKCLKSTTSTLNKTVGLFASLCIFTVMLITLRLDLIADKIHSLSDTKRIYIFMVSVPFLIGAFCYLALRFSRFVKAPYRYYYFIMLLFLCLFISIPVGYGDNIFDIEIYPVVGFDYADGVNIQSVKALKKDIETQGKGTLFFIMGHTTDREIFIDNQSLSPPANMILVERSLIKFLKISRDKINSLRDIMQKQKEIMPIKGAEAAVKIETLPERIESLIARETK